MNNFNPKSCHTFPTLNFIPKAYHTFVTLNFIPKAYHTFVTLNFIPKAYHTFVTLNFIPKAYHTFVTLNFNSKACHSVIYYTFCDVIIRNPRRIVISDINKTISVKYFFAIKNSEYFSSKLRFCLRFTWIIFHKELLCQAPYSYNIEVITLTYV